MSGKSNYFQNLVNSYLLGAETFTLPTVFYLGLWKSPVLESDETSGDVADEVDGSAYVRATINNDSTSWSGIEGSRENAVDIIFPTAGDNWGVVTHIGICDDSGGSGKILYYAELSSPKTVSTGDIVKFSAGNLVINEN